MNGIRRGDTREVPASVEAAWRTIAECSKQIEEGRDFIVLVLTNRQPPTGVKARLTRSEGPLGEILNYTDRDGGSIVARFRPVAVRRFLQSKLRDAGWADE